MYASEKNLQIIAEQNDFKIARVTPLTGGDINEVYLITTTSAQDLVIKLNDSQRFPGMFRSERAGLEALSRAGIFTVPRVISTGETKNVSYLILEYIATAEPAKEFWQHFGVKLARLHRITADGFGFGQDNYIGSLVQLNNWCKTAAEFYISQRLEPQLKMAKDKGFDLGPSAPLFRQCERLIPDENSSLIHGDLWAGNYMIDPKGRPCLIDPATAYASREMDLAMMELFGGFEPQLFRSYEAHFPTKEGYRERVALWQLYYLLVHLNIFGVTYKTRVSRIMATYS